MSRSLHVGLLLGQGDLEVVLHQALEAAEEAFGVGVRRQVLRGEGKLQDVQVRRPPVGRQGPVQKGPGKGRGKPRRRQHPHELPARQNSFRPHSHLL